MHQPDDDGCGLNIRLILTSYCRIALATEWRMPLPRRTIAQENIRA